MKKQIEIIREMYRIKEEAELELKNMEREKRRKERMKKIKVVIEKEEGSF